jgi:hypothetical protein
MPYFCGAYGVVRHRIPYFCGACTGAPQNTYFYGEDSVEYHPYATKYIYSVEIFPTSECFVRKKNYESRKKPLFRANNFPRLREVV